VLIGQEHWAGVVETAEGDRGARTYLRTHPPLLVECGDLATGRDVDTPDAL
jgi:CTP:molybdopterin cytidylyltransferase MocA